MRPIMYAAKDAPFQLISHSVCTRAAYLVFDRFFPTELATMGVLLDSLFDPKTTSIPQMIHHLKAHDEALDADDLLYKWKAMKHIKHKNPRQLVALKQMERIVTDIYEETIEGMRKVFTTAALYPLHSLHTAYDSKSTDTSDHVMWGYSSCSPEPERFDDEYFPVSMIMRLGIEADELPKAYTVEETDPSFFPIEDILGVDAHAAGGKLVNMMPLEFFLQEGVDDSILRVDDPGAADENNIWMEPYACIPLLTTYSAAELNSLRDELASARNALNIVADEWIARRTADNTCPADSLQFFKREVLPATSALNEAIDNSQTVSKLKTVVKDKPHVAEVWIGEAPVTAIWDFYRANGGLAEETEKRLQRSLENGHCKGRRPIIAIRPPKFMVAESLKQRRESTNTVYDETLFAPRKTIMVD